MPKPKWELPTTVKVGVYDYMIQPMPKGVEPDLYGDVNTATHILRVRTDMGLRLACTTVHHEVVHACIAERSVAHSIIELVLAWKDSDSGNRPPPSELADMVEERIVRGAGDGTHAVWRDNPKLWMWLHRGICGVGK